MCEMKRRILKCIFSFVAVFSMVFAMPVVSNAEGTDASTNTEESSVENAKETNIYTLKIYYVDTEGNPKAPTYNESFEEGYVYDVTSPTQDGFIPDQTEVKGTLNKDTEITVTYYSDQITYTVEHYLPDLNGNYSTPKDTDSLVGTAGSYTRATPKSYTGFYLDGTVEQEKLEEPNQLGGKTQVIKIYYTRSNLAVNFVVNGGEYVDPISSQYGKTVDISGVTTTKPGYKFDGWYTDAALTNKAGSTVTLSTAAPINLYAKWVIGDPVAYTINYYTENADDDGYTFLKTDKTQTAVAETDISTLTSTQQAITYFTYDYQKDNSNGKINGDGTTIINVYYKRNVYKCTFTIGNGASIVIDGKTYDDTNKYSFEAKYGAKIDKLWPLSNNVTPNEVNGSQWYAWYCSRDNTNYVSKRLTMTPQMCNTDSTANTDFTGRWSGSVLKYNLHYMTQTVDGTGVHRLDSNGIEDTTDPVLFEDNTTYSQIGLTPSGNWSAKDIEGYTVYGDKYQENEAGDDGAIDVYFYYTRDKSAFVLYNYNNVSYTGDVYYNTSVVANYNALTTAQKEPARPSGLTSAYKFKGWYLNQDCNDADTSDDVKFDSSNANTSTVGVNGVILYAKWEADTHKVTFNYNDGSTPNNVVEVVHKGTVTKPTDPTRDGYVFNGWYNGNTPYVFDTTKVTTDVTLTAHWLKVEYTSYTVNYIYASDTGNSAGKDVVAPITESAIIGTNVVKTAVEVPGYVPDQRYKQIDQIKDGNNNEITFKYSPLDKELYWRVEYVDQDGNKIADSVVEHGKVSKATANAKTIKGYTLTSGSSQTIILGKEESKDAIKQNVIKFVYTAEEHNLTIHYVFEKPDAENAILKPNDYTDVIATDEKYEVVSPTIEGYECDQEVVKGTMGTSDVEITVTYKVIGNGETPIDPVDPVIPVGPTTPTNGSSSSNTTGTSASTTVKTGDNSNLMPYGILIGIAFIGILSVLRKKEN